MRAGYSSAEAALQPAALNPAPAALHSAAPRATNRRAEIAPQSEPCPHLDTGGLIADDARRCGSQPLKSGHGCGNPVFRRQDLLVVVLKEGTLLLQLQSLLYCD